MPLYKPSSHKPNLHMFIPEWGHYFEKRILSNQKRVQQIDCVHLSTVVLKVASINWVAILTVQCF